MAVSSRKSSGLRSLSPSERFYSSHYTSSPSVSSSAFASSSSSFSSRTATTFFHRSASPTRLTVRGGASPSASTLRFSLDRPISPSRSISVGMKSNQAVKRQSNQKRTCLCSPTNHPGSFRCSLHKSFGNSRSPAAATAPYSPNRLNARRSAMTNSVVRIGGVEGGDLVKRALAALIRPSSHQQRRRGAFQPRPSRLSVMSRAGEEVSWRRLGM